MSSESLSSLHVIYLFLGRRRHCEPVNRGPGAGRCSPLGAFKFVGRALGGVRGTRAGAAAGQWPAA